MGRSVTMGDHTYEIVPQKIGYLMHKLGPRLREILEAEVDELAGIDLVASKTHEVLKVFVPDLMPLHEFLGYASPEALTAGEYAESVDRSPEPLQIKDAFKAASDVNGGEVFKHLKALWAAISPKLQDNLQGFIVAKMAETGATPSPTSPTKGSSPTSPPTSGESDLTSSGTAPPTSEPSAG